MFKTIIYSLLNICIVSGLSWLVFTDSHIDLDYKENTPNNCLFWSKIGTKCCRESSIPLKPYNLSSKWGDINCDIPSILFEGIIEWVKNNLLTIYNFDFIVNTGDDCSHKDISQPFMNENIKTINYVWNIVNNNFPDIPYYGVYGNHDEYIVDQTPPLIGNKFIKQSSKNWNKWISDPNLLYGYYSQLYIEKSTNTTFKIISFNSIYYDTNNFWIINNTDEDSKRINNQFKWLDYELSQSIINNNKVLFLNHIPIHSGEASSYYNDNLIPILNKYSSNIILNSNGHTHRNSFRLVKYNNNYIDYGFIPLSMTSDNHFPSFRVYIYNFTTNNLDYINYICNLTKIIKQNYIDCEEEYIFSNEYNLDGINLNNTIKLYNKIINNDTYFQKYYKHYSSGGNYPECITTSCKQQYFDEIIN